MSLGGITKEAWFNGDVDYDELLDEMTQDSEHCPSDDEITAYIENLPTEAELKAAYEGSD